MGDSHDPLISRRDVLKRVGVAGAAAAMPIEADRGDRASHTRAI